MLVPYNRLVTTESAYTTAFQAEEMKNLQDLGIHGETLPANQWKREHLFACKVHVAPITPALLPAYADADISQRQDFDQQVSKFIAGVPADHVHLFEHELVHIHGPGLGPVFYALGKVKHTLASSPGLACCDGLSGRRTFYLLTGALRLVLAYSHPTLLDKALEVRASLEVHLEAGDIKFASIDDGGLCTKTIHRMDKRCIATIQAKEQVLVHDGQPTVSDKSLSQMTCEAILAHAIGETVDDSVILVHAAGHHVCFLEFQITESYMTQLVTGKTPDEPLIVVIGKMLDLDTAAGRRGFVDNVQHLIAKSIF
ncbi:hypothetical protein NW768_007563 [Fusarium equiseti]|uniref:Uncharacterized protein n=1 Tax=Fusarium equiseti TaxID=61235 RepID=A0ABQ8R7U3_FUSEQ|nr:hypothetical protein NW768_007563 [Fusarium equiseti]